MLKHGGEFTEERRGDVELDVVIGYVVAVLYVPFVVVTAVVILQHFHYGWKTARFRREPPAVSPPL
jgi:hypothetical protein